MSHDTTHTPGRFHLIEALHDAWRLTKRHKRKSVILLAPFVLAIIAVEVIVVAPTLGFDAVTNLTGNPTPLITQLLLLALKAPIWGLLLVSAARFGLQRAAGKPANNAVIRQSLPLLPHGLVIAVLVLAPELIFANLIPLGALLGFAIGLMFLMSAYYVVDQQQDAFQGLKSSVKLVMTNPGQSVLFLLCVLAGLIASVFTLGAGFVLTLPLAVTVGAAIYAQAEGLHGDYETTPEKN